MNTIFTPNSCGRLALAESDMGTSGSLDPFTPPAYALPVSHLTITEACLSCLHHPWPNCKGPKTTRAWPGMRMVLVGNLWKGLTEAAESVLVLHAHKLVLLLIERLVLAILIRALAQELHPFSHPRCLCCLSGVEQMGRTVVRRDARWFLWIPEATTIVTPGAATVARDTVIAPHILAIVIPPSIWVEVFNACMLVR